MLANTRRCDEPVAHPSARQSSARTRGGLLLRFGHGRRRRRAFGRRLGFGGPSWPAARSRAADIDHGAVAAGDLRDRPSAGSARGRRMTTISRSLRIAGRARADRCSPCRRAALEPQLDALRRVGEMHHDAAGRAEPDVVGLVALAARGGLGARPVGILVVGGKPPGADEIRRSSCPPAAAPTAGGGVDLRSRAAARAGRERQPAAPVTDNGPAPAPTAITRSSGNPPASSRRQASLGWKRFVARRPNALRRQQSPLARSQDSTRPHDIAERAPARTRPATT